MPENEFEKKVSSEMQELRFRPSEKVWLQVEERIRKKKKRRVFVIIFFLAGLALLGYWQRDNLFGETKNDIVNVEKQNEDNSIATGEPTNSSATDQNIETAKQSEIKNTIDKTAGEEVIVDKPGVNKKNAVIPKPEIYSTKKKTKNETRNKPGPVKTKIREESKEPGNDASAKQQKQNLVTDDTKIKDTVGLKDNDAIKQEEVKQSEIKPVENRIDTINTGVMKQKKDIIETGDTVLKIKTKDSAAAIVQKNLSEKKWKWGLHITPGISSLNGRSLSFGSQTTADAFNYQSPVTGGTTGAPRVIQKPSEPSPGFAFQAGGSAQRQLSSRTGFSLGLQFGYYSNQIGIGNRRNSALRFNQSANMSNNNDVYNAGGDTVKFTNQYHFIELPINFQWQLNKNKVKPFIWSIGLTPGQLIASNALMYDTAFGGVYYENKNLLNKTQFSMSTGFSWTIANTHRAQWNIGPVTNIHLNKLFDSPFENKQYLFFVGLRTAVLFNQKK
jgi:hypothetical protein